MSGASWKSARGPTPKPASSACCASSMPAFPLHKMLALSIENLVVRFPDLPVPALDIAALALEPGGRMAVMGSSGSGKTTFINIVTGMDRASSGQVAWNGQSLSQMSEGRRDRWRSRNVGLVMQDFHLFPGLSAQANVLLPQRLAHFSLPEGMHE